MNGSNGSSGSIGGNGTSDNTWTSGKRLTARTFSMTTMSADGALCVQTSLVAWRQFRDHRAKFAAVNQRDVIEVECARGRHAVIGREHNLRRQLADRPC